MALTTTLLQIAQLADSANEMLPLLQAARDAYSDEEWEALEEQHPALCELVAACADIEAAVEAMG
jgi:hypothetical protein